MEQKYAFQQHQTFSIRQQQASAILQMGRIELQDFLKESVLDNPLLEFDDSKIDEFEIQDFVSKMDWLKETDIQNYAYYNYDNDNQEEISRFGTPSEESLSEYVLSQFITLKLEKEKQKILNFLIFSLDEKGYFTESISDTAKLLHTTKSEVAECLDLLKSADPAGIGAKDLQECLMLQLKRKKADTPIMRKLVYEELELLGKNQLSQLSKKLQISMDELLKNFKAIQELNPKPANGFAHREHLKYLKPDITVVKFPDRFEIISNDSWGQISIHSYYRKLLDENIDASTKNYIKEKLSQAKWTIQCIQQRTSTLSDVAKAIVELQADFFENGNRFLLPLSLKQVGEKLGLHESTISRTVKNKYLLCSWGIYPMSYFFVKKFNDNRGNTLTAIHAKELLKQLIEQENKISPLSDQKLSELLKNNNISISRRTVAKYRESLGIPDAAGRKQYK